VRLALASYAGVMEDARPSSTPSEIKALVANVKENAVPRRNSQGGTHAAENLISALRCLYNRAVDDGLIEEKDNPARKVEVTWLLPGEDQTTA
jgi:integrase/recombinase XerC